MASIFEIIAQLGAAGVELITKSVRQQAEQQALEEAPIFGTAVHSSVIEEMDYNPEARTMLVTFKSGAKYIYSNVRPELAQQWLAAESKGRFLNDVIKSGFIPYTRIA